MAIIKCKECGKEFSNKASFCPIVVAHLMKVFLKRREFFGKIWTIIKGKN